MQIQSKRDTVMVSKWQIYGLSRSGAGTGGRWPFPPPFRFFPDKLCGTLLDFSPSARRQRPEHLVKSFRALSLSGGSSPRSSCPPALSGSFKQDPSNLRMVRLSTKPAWCRSSIMVWTAFCASLRYRFIVGVFISSPLDPCERRGRTRRGSSSRPILVAPGLEPDQHPRPGPVLLLVHGSILPLLMALCGDLLPPLCISMLGDMESAIS